MIGSPDLLPFTGSEGFEGPGEQREARSLPEEFSVPLLPSAHPWTTRAQFHRDFILVAEFSEQVGPVPVLFIPDDKKALGSFDYNHFSVRIMSVDYQASGPVHTPSASPGPRLNFSEDSKVILGDSAEDAFAYVHHLTLYDLEARGMVRPFCMAYVCSDQMKLMENFSELAASFSQASDSLKTGNRQAFSTELRRKLQELESRRLTLQQEKELQRMSESTEEEVKHFELEALDNLILNHRELLHQVISYPNRKLQQPDFLPYDLAEPLTDLTVLQPPSPSALPTSSCRSEHLLKPLEELCSSYFVSLMKEQLADTERHLHGDRSVLQSARVTRSLSRKLKLTNFLFELWRPGDTEDEEAEGAEVMSQKVSGSNKEVQSEPQGLEMFFSCVEEIPIKLEAGEAVTTTSEPRAAADMTGSVSSGDSIEVLSTERSYRTQQIVAGLDGRETPVGTTDVCVRRAALDAGVRRVRTYAKRANSEDSIEVLSTTESIFPEDLTAITEEEAEPHLLSNGFKNEEESPTEREPDEEGRREGKTMNAPTSENEYEGSADREDPLKETPASVPIEEDSVSVKRNEVPEDVPQEKIQKPLQAEAAVESTATMMRSVPHLHVDFALPAPLPEISQRAPPSTPLRLLSVDEVSDCTSFTSSSEPPSPTRNNHGNMWVEKRRRRKAGLRALRFIKHHSFSQHAVFCLLSGRPLVVVGGSEILVRKLVDALSLFLPAPGPDGSSVMFCLTTPLQLSDLLTWRLIGIHRTSSSSSATIIHSLTRYSRYVALLDLDQKTLQSPPYSGSLLATLADPHTGIRRGHTYLPHLESCLISLSNQALLHTFLPSSQGPKAAAGDISTEKDSVCTRGSCSSESDLRVMDFLSELIKQRHAGRGPPFLRFSYSSLHLYKNTFAT